MNKKAIMVFKRYNMYQKESIKCICGHTVFLPSYEPVKICSHCGKLVFKNEKAKFMYYLGEKRGLYLG